MVVLGDSWKPLTKLGECTCCIIFGYFEHDIGFEGADLEKCNRIGASRSTKETNENQYKLKTVSDKQRKTK